MLQEMLQFLVNIVIFSSMIGSTRLGTDTKEYFKTAFFSQVTSILLENEFLKKPISTLIEEKLKEVQEETEKLKEEVKELRKSLRKLKKNDADVQENRLLKKNDVNINFSLENFSKSTKVLSLHQVGNNGEDIPQQDRTETFLSLDKRENFVENSASDQLMLTSNKLFECGENRTLENSKTLTNTMSKSDNINKIPIHSGGMQGGVVNTTKKMRKNSWFIQDSNENSHVFAAPIKRKSTFFATYFSLSTTKNQLESYLKNRLGITDVFCEEISVNKNRKKKLNTERKYLSFKIVIDWKFRDVLCMSDVWPEGVVVKRFRKYGGLQKMGIAQND